MRRSGGRRSSSSRSRSHSSSRRSSRRYYSRRRGYYYDDYPYRAHRAGPILGLFLIGLFIVLPVVSMLGFLVYLPVTIHLSPQEMYLIEKNSFIVDEIIIKDPSSKVEAYVFSSEPVYSEDMFVNSTSENLNITYERYETFTRYFLAGSKINVTWVFDNIVEVYVFKKADYTNWVNGNDNIKYEAFKKAENGSIQVTTVDHDEYNIVFYNSKPLVVNGIATIKYEAKMFDLTKNVADKHTGNWIKYFGMFDSFKVVLYNPTNDTEITVNIEYSWRTEIYLGILGLFFAFYIFSLIRGKSKKEEEKLLTTSQPPMPAQGATIGGISQPSGATMPPPQSSQPSGFGSAMYSGRGESKKCPKCGAIALKDDRFCSECGTPLN